MDIDELVSTIGEEDLRDSLARWVYEWKKDTSDVYKLYELIAKWHGNVWFSDRSMQNDFWSSLRSFKKDAIDGVGGMTVHERLYWFGLLEEWAHSDEVDQLRIRDKLLAHP